MRRGEVPESIFIKVLERRLTRERYWRKGKHGGRGSGGEGK